MSDFHPNLIKDPQAALDFIYGGSAVFTLKSLKTGDRYTYKVNKKEDDLYFAGLLTGPDNLSDYAYIGYSKGPQTGFAAGRKNAEKLENFPPHKALKWAVAQFAAGNMPEQLECWHEGRCAMCAKRLTDPVSIERGIGPECMKKIS